MSSTCAWGRTSPSFPSAKGCLTYVLTYVRVRVIVENVWRVLICSRGWGRAQPVSSIPQHNRAEPPTIKTGALLFPQDSRLIYTLRHKAAGQGHPWLHSKVMANSLKETPQREKERGTSENPNSTHIWCSMSSNYETGNHDHLNFRHFNYCYFFFLKHQAT